MSYKIGKNTTENCLLKRPNTSTIFWTVPVLNKRTLDAAFNKFDNDMLSSNVDN